MTTYNIPRKNGPSLYYKRLWVVFYFETREKPPIDYWKLMQQIYDIGSSLDRLRELARMQGWIQNTKLEETEEALNNLIRKIGDRMIVPEKVDVKETLAGR